MYSLSVFVPAEEMDWAIAELWAADTAGIRELGDGDVIHLIAGFETNALRTSLMECFAAFSPDWTQEDATDWVEETQRAWPPRAVGERLFIAAPWCAEPTPAGRIRIIQNPGLACGTGEHPCTQLALAALERIPLAGKTVADIGTGSGLLAMAALKLGAKRAVGIDTDRAALDAAVQNYALNGLTPELAAGSADCLRWECADVTVANISGTVLLSIRDELERITKPGGHIILTGFPECEAGSLGDGELTSSSGWACLTLRRH